MSKRLDQSREARLQPKRMSYYSKKLSDMGYKIVTHAENCIRFVHNGETVTVYPYSGWASGKSIKDGRGFKELLKQLSADKKKEPRQ